jgi:CheY-like chemotaxis protein
MHRCFPIWEQLCCPGIDFIGPSGLKTWPAKINNQESGLAFRRSAENRESDLLDYHRGTETILLVDDEESLRNVVVDLLSQLGYRVLSAAGGPDALQVAREYPGKIDLLLTDVVMDDLNGPELAEQLLKIRPGIKVIFISGYADSSLAPDGVLKPGTVLVQKPFSIKILSAKVREVLGSQGGD